MKQKLLVGVLAAALLVIAGCSKEENEGLPLYTPGIQPTVTHEVTEVPAYVADYFRDCIVINYSTYAEEFYTRLYAGEITSMNEMGLEVAGDLSSHSIAVPTKDFEQYNIKPRSKVYLSAGITKYNGVYNPCPDDMTSLRGPFFAYLKNLKPRN